MCVPSGRKLSCAKSAGRILGVVTMITFAAGCNQEAKKKRPESTAAASTPPAPEKQPSGSEVHLIADAEYSVGEQAISLLLEPSEPWHVNLEYPVAVNVINASGIVIEKRHLGKEDAFGFSEDRAEFRVPFVAKSPGKAEVKVSFSYAVCTDESCLPKETTLEKEFSVVAKEVLK